MDWEEIKRLAVHMSHKNDTLRLDYPLLPFRVIYYPNKIAK